MKEYNDLVGGFEHDIFKLEETDWNRHNRRHAPREMTEEEEKYYNPPLYRDNTVGNYSIASRFIFWDMDRTRAPKSIYDLKIG